MKKILGVLLLLCSGAFASTLTVTWSYDYTVDTACSAIVTSNCVDHFEVFDVTSGSRVLIGSVLNPGSPSTTGPTVGIAGTFKIGPPYGSRTLNVIAVAKDSAGNRVESSPAAATFSTKPAAPFNLTAGAQ